ncbi:hypothetical protein EJB05_48664 [Eragrostis curvula]|uniref:Response regulatory domain-containing protein n=1 Tax=Eragrostis curvula TaxID=38414 RepID=A0A5J9T3D0_9POAL|nr:hypothetical protein EJB05_48664 [Eragrostis curvula]
MAVVSPRVLVVDCTGVGRMYKTKLLSKFNFQATAVSSVEEALNFLDAENDVNLILADYFMDGGMRGYDLLTKVKESSKLKHIPVVITCTEDDPDLIKKCMEEGAKGFFLTPLKFEDVPTLLSFI